MRNFALGIVVTLVVLAFASWLFLKLGYADLRSDAGPSWLESELAVSALHASAARHALGQQNPVPSTEANLLDGRALPRQVCRLSRRPDNPVSDYGRAFYPRVPQFMNAPSLPENRTFYIIKYGVRWTAMPAWGDIMADSEIWQTVTFLSHLGNLPPSVQQELHRPAGSTP